MKLFINLEVGLGFLRLTMNLDKVLKNILIFLGFSGFMIFLDFVDFSLFLGFMGFLIFLDFLDKLCTSEPDFNSTFFLEGTSGLEPDTHCKSKLRNRVP